MYGVACSYWVVDGRVAVHAQSGTMPMAKCTSSLAKPQAEPEVTIPWQGMKGVDGQVDTGPPCPSQSSRLALAQR